MPLFVPLAGVTDTQLNDSDTLQETLDIIEDDLVSPAATKLREAGETAREAAGTEILIP